MRPRTIQSWASILLGVAVIGLLALGEARATTAPSSESPEPYATLLTAGLPVASAPARPAPPDVLLPHAVITVTEHLATWPTPQPPTQPDRAPQPKAPLYLRELVLLL